VTDASTVDGRQQNAAQKTARIGINKLMIERRRVLVKKVAIIEIPLITSGESGSRYRRCHHRLFLQSA
jgi:hypothetical protein